MGLELLTQADYVLNACGRPVPPPGYKFVDLPKIIPFHHRIQIGSQSYCYVAENGGVQFTNISGLPVTLNIGASGPFVVVDGTTITINGEINAGTLTISQFLALWASVPAATALLTASLAGASCGTTTGTPDTTPFYNGPATNAFTLFFTEPFPTQDYVANNSNTLFICKGIMIESDPVQIRIKWPNGRYWNQFPSGNPYAGNGACFPQGTGGNLYALNEPVPIPADGKVAVEMSGPNGGDVNIHLWGVLRYLLKETGGVGQVNQNTCIVGYPANAQALTGLQMMDDPIEVLKSRQRFHCWPNGNIFAPEFRLGNQCETDTPKGYVDESYTFFSDPIVIPGAGQSYSNPVNVPGQDDVVIRRWRAIVEWSDGATGNPVVQIRTPSGYSTTGGDQIPIYLGYWFPMFPTLRVIAGTRLILDVADSNLGDPTDTTITVTFEFDAVKRRKLAA